MIDNKIDINGEQKKMYKYLIVTDNGEEKVNIDADFDLIHIKGTVTDSEDKPVEGATVKLCVGDKYGILEEVTNFETEDECFENLRNHFTGEVLDDVMSWNKVNGTYMYNGKLYHLHSGMWGMGSPAKIFYETAKWTKQSDIEYIVTVQSGYVGSDWMWTFKFIVEDGRWKISESKCTEY